MRFWLDHTAEGLHTNTIVVVMLQPQFRILKPFIAFIRNPPPASSLSEFKIKIDHIWKLPVDSWPTYCRKIQWIVPCYGKSDDNPQFHSLLPHPDKQLPLNSLVQLSWWAVFHRMQKWSCNFVWYQYHQSSSNGWVLQQTSNRIYVGVQHVEVETASTQTSLYQWCFLVPRLPLYELL